jgi:hypothetical protein
MTKAKSCYWSQFRGENPGTPRFILSMLAVFPFTHDVRPVDNMILLSCPTLILIGRIHSLG